MKKILLAASIALATNTVVADLSMQKIEAQAKAANLSANFVKSLKDGTLPRAKGKIGITYANLKSKVPTGDESWPDTIYGLPSYITVNKTNTKNQAQKYDIYGFYNAKLYDEYGMYSDYFTSTNLSHKEKVDFIFRSYNYKLSKQSIEKNFGKQYKVKDGHGNVRKDTGIYKAGKYYLYVYSDKYDDYSEVAISTKGALLKYFNYKKIYR